MPNMIKKGLLPLFLLCFSLIVDAGVWTRHSGIRGIVYPTCNIDFLNNGLKAGFSTAESNCQIAANGFSPSQPWRMQKGESVCGDCGSICPGYRYYCETNPDPCVDPQIWSNDLKTCIDPPDQEASCNAQDGMYFDNGVCGSVPDCPFDNQTFNKELGSCEDPDCDYPNYPIAAGSTLTCGNCGDTTGLLYESATKSCICTDGTMCVTPDHDDGTCPQGAVNTLDGCGCKSGDVKVTAAGSGSNGTCKPEQPCNSSSPYYTGTITKNGQTVDVCDLSEAYADSDQDDCGIVNGSIVCVPKNPCSYESLLNGGCSDPSAPSDIDGDGQLDGGDEGISMDSDGVMPSDSSGEGGSGGSGGSGGGGSGGGFGAGLPSVGSITTDNGDGTSTTSEIDFSPVTGRQDQQTEQLTKQLVEDKRTNKKLDTLNNMLSGFFDDLDQDLPDMSPASYDHSGIDSELAALESEYQAEFNAVRTQFGSSFSALTVSVNASLPSFGFEWKGHDVIVDMDKFSDFFHNTGLIIFALASFLSFTIVLRK